MVTLRKTMIITVFTPLFESPFDTHLSWFFQFIGDTKPNPLTTFIILSPMLSKDNINFSYRVYDDRRGELTQKSIKNTTTYYIRDIDHRI